jgi:hypothetical protein
MMFDLFQKKSKTIEKVTVQFMPSDTRVFADVGQGLSEVAEEGIAHCICMDYLGFLFFIAYPLLQPELKYDINVEKVNVERA